jgi:class 3 adenylate cyclase
MGASDGATTGLKTPGDVIAGALGDEHRLECTVVGDAVNTAARMERLTADLGTPLLISADVVAAAPGLNGSCGRRHSPATSCGAAASRFTPIGSPSLRQ